MRGITEERLKEVFSKLYWSRNDEKELFNALLSECTELNAWQPIDENTPKDRRLNLYWKDYGWITGQLRLGQFFCDANLMAPCNIAPTHWQELPKDPV